MKVTWSGCAGHFGGSFNQYQYPLYIDRYMNLDMNVVVFSIFSEKKFVLQN